jgi:hypothetical protein
MGESHRTSVAPAAIEGQMKCALDQIHDRQSRAELIDRLLIG